jgi:hypothetical protein
LLSAIAMSALCQKRTSPNSLDHLVGGGEQRLWNGETKRFGSLEIDRKLELGRLSTNKPVFAPLLSVLRSSLRYLFI